MSASSVVVSLFLFYSCFSSSSLLFSFLLFFSPLFPTRHSRSLHQEPDIECVRCYPISQSIEDRIRLWLSRSRSNLGSLRLFGISKGDVSLCFFYFSFFFLSLLVCFLFMCRLRRMDRVTVKLMKTKKKKEEGATELDRNVRMILVF